MNTEEEMGAMRVKIRDLSQSQGDEATKKNVAPWQNFKSSCFQFEGFLFQKYPRLHRRVKLKFH